MKSKAKLAILGGLIIFFTTISLYFDSEIVKAVSFIRTDFLNNFFMGLTFISSEIIIFFFLTSLFLWKEHKRKWILPLWFTLGLSAVISFVLKILVQRPRPFQQGIVSVLDVLRKNVHLIWNFSFPSFHAMLAFCAVPILSKEFPKLKYVWVAFASLVAFSRIYFGLHFLSDVIIGSAIGCFIGMAIIKIEKKNKFWEKIYNKIFKIKK
ncbi:phosphatase PAP2 family protein [Candidatus Pacearchaeota archaeon]|nr:phosphatase PAP2 family protein [Candidatus Pacearchaeota archaeon]